MITFQQLPAITRGVILSESGPAEIKYLLTDSRKSFYARGALFFAISGKRHDGHSYISNLYQEGVRQFVVEKDLDVSAYPESNFLKVDNVITALQSIAQHHRENYKLLSVGITGSNGKTIIKEWLHQMLASYKKVVKSPHSYNSQIGVPLSVWQINDLHEVGIFEAGISTTGEMQKLASIIQPEIGIFTNIGSAHAQGFASIEEKVKEKASLFDNARQVIYCKDHKLIDQALQHKGFTWGHSAEADIHIISQESKQGQTSMQIAYKGHNHVLNFPFASEAALQNSMHCVAFLTLMGFEFNIIQKGLDKLQTIPMRLEMKKALNGSSLIDDTYNNDLAGLRIAVEFLSHQTQHPKRTVILSDIQQSDLNEEELYQQINTIFKAADIKRFIGIGPVITKNKGCFDIPSSFYENTADFLNDFDLSQLQNELILVKGARSFTFEKVVRALEERLHGTQLQINLDALTHNLNFYKSRLKPETRLMVMVKAFAYGSGSLEIANLMQFHRVDYLGVAYADEGMFLRTNGIYLPIMVMNPSEDSFETIIRYDLEPEIYNLNILNNFISYLDGRPAKIHLKLDTGMHRLGFEKPDLEELLSLLKANPNLVVKSIFSHLAGADEAEHKDFSYQQAKKVKDWSDIIKKGLGYAPIVHLLNSPGIIRFPDLQFDMVRLGIGLYGLDTNNLEQQHLLPISRLKTMISQIKKVNPGETVGYSRKGKVNHEMKIATIAIGYADGFNRGFGNGNGEVWINGKKAPVIGNVCMDMTMIDVTNIDAQEGDEVEVFGEHVTITEMADKINTIPYEILTNVSQRVKRIYYTE
ncbi:bifunctional UDP-N-acetylmuramoyl-tripeptide:D-alanyl-D-alanine ligase/alanine racemase [Fulvivirga maritima]|uniref:bifunctional UDP-N-acetylmuramoyl-tripeptide:D-alanyl-D-alanine ligase/alanine racemase n=1 Tax=Fulvivirga maritima TaxID=2904247 RepID=UPI001F25335E|nr:bifunctional UDP-N-acetylmuramoyl-tripeptide:D-alanyl-D-alanine ligase/alanine racemase [Fulvivirga maritima]UII28006.1 bifunctional UDP-N-acetylmuramoyl-tripeptide:D-alanyl-D-alanine ligase/alanine racemase [Fulvivirga maritima]